MSNIRIENSRLHDILIITEELNLLNDLDAVLNFILLQTRLICKADAGSIFLMENGSLKFSYFQNDTLAKRDICNTKFIYTKLELKVDDNSIAGYCAFHGRNLNLSDVYQLDNNYSFSFNSEFDKILDYKTISVLAVPLTNSQNKIIGVMQIINALDDFDKPIPFSEEDEMLVSFFGVHAAGALEKAVLTREIILRMIRMAEMRDPKETGAHVNRVGAYSVEIYRHWARKKNINEKEIKHKTDILRIASMSHDVGKVAISDLILKKPAKLDNEEFAIMQTHTTYGAALFINPVSEIDIMSADIASCHHEKFDGSGYPFKLAKETIPFMARIVAIADVYDALISRRTYKEAWHEDDVLLEILSQKGKRFDPQLIDAFIEIYDVIKAIRNRYQDIDELAIGVNHA